MAPEMEETAGKLGDSGVLVRPARFSDCPGILEIYNEAVLNTTASYDYEPRSLAHREEWLAAHERDRFPVFVAEASGGEVLGWSALNKFHDRVGYRFTSENSIYVAPAWRGRGLGGRLLAPLIEAAPARGLHAVIACIDAQNEASLRLHQRFGFQRVGLFRRVGYKFNRWLDVVYLELMIEPAPC